MNVKTYTKSAKLYNSLIQILHSKEVLDQKIEWGNQFKNEAEKSESGVVGAFHTPDCKTKKKHSELRIVDKLVQF